MVAYRFAREKQVTQIRIICEKCYVIVHALSQKFPNFTCTHGISGAIWQTLLFTVIERRYVYHLLQHHQ